MRVHPLQRPGSGHPGASPRNDPVDPARKFGILHVVDSLAYGGLERVVSDLAIQQRAEGHAVHVFSIYRSDGFRGYLESAGIPVIVGDKRRPLDLGVLRTLRAAADRHDVGIIHTHNFLPNYHAAAAMLGSWQRHALVNTCHNMGTRLSSPRLRWLYRWSLRHTARVAMVGEQVKRRFTLDGTIAPSQAVTVLNGIPVARFHSDASLRKAARAQLGIDCDAPLIGSVGRLVDLKNHRLLISCLPRIIASHPAAKVVLIGDGPAEADLRRHARALGVQEHVVFAGVREDVATLLPGLDIFALPSRTEGLSIALLEACAAGLAVVASSVGGNPEIIREGVTGRLFESEDGHTLGCLLLELLDDDMQRRRLGDSARRWVVANASIDAMSTSYRRLYETALPS